MNSRKGKRMPVSWAVSSILPGTLLEAEGDPLGQGGRKEKAGDRNDPGHQEQDVEDVGGQPVLGLLAFGPFGRQDGDEGRRKGRLGEEVAEHVRDAEGDVEGVGCGALAGPEEVGEDHLPDQAHDPADGRADGEGADPPADVFHGQPLLAI